MENINSAVAEKVHPHTALGMDLNSYFVEMRVDSFSTLKFANILQT